jgi:hypothetical protein
MMVRVSRGFSSLDDNNDERKETINGDREERGRKTAKKTQQRFMRRENCLDD